MNRITHGRLLEVLHYDRESGVFTWRINPNNDVGMGDAAGAKHSANNDMIRITVDGCFYLAHRLAWFYVHGKWPRHQVDHRDGIQCNNWIANLREATNQQNAFNRKVDARNKSGATGVYLNKRSGKWVAQIQRDGKNHGCGNYDTLDDAIAGRRAAAIRLFGEFAGELRS